MKLKIGSNTYSASQLEKAIPALAGAISGKPYFGSIRITYYACDTVQWYAEAFNKKHSLRHDVPSASQWKALCNLVIHHAAEFARFGVEVVK